MNVWVFEEEGWCTLTSLQTRKRSRWEVWQTTLSFLWCPCQLCVNTVPAGAAVQKQQNLNGFMNHKAVLRIKLQTSKEREGHAGQKCRNVHINAWNSKDKILENIICSIFVWLCIKVIIQELKILVSVLSYQDHVSFNKIVIHQQDWIWDICSARQLFRPQSRVCTLKHGRGKCDNMKTSP